MPIVITNHYKGSTTSSFSLYKVSGNVMLLSFSSVWIRRFPGHKLFFYTQSSLHKYYSTDLVLICIVSRFLTILLLDLLLFLVSKNSVHSERLIPSSMSALFSLKAVIESLTYIADLQFTYNVDLLLFPNCLPTDLSFHAYMGSDVVHFIFILVCHQEYSVCYH